jgi:hypothetical protein
VFIKNGTNYINLDQVGKATIAQRMGGRDVATGFYSASGSQIDTGQLPDLEHATAPLVPSSAVVIAIDPMGRTTAHPVAAFRVVKDAAEPIFAVAPPEGAVLFQMIGGQTLVGSDGTIFADLATARSAVIGGPAPAPVEPEAVEPTPKLAGRRR